MSVSVSVFKCDNKDDCLEFIYIILPFYIKRTDKILVSMSGLVKKRGSLLDDRT